jgi:hypothetical protein
MSKKNGGLGIRILEKKMNLSLIAKWIWRWFKNDSWWKEATPSASEAYRPWKYLNASRFWRNVAKVKDVFNTSTSFDIGNGKMTLFWQDSWLGSPIKYRYPKLYNGIAQSNYTIIDMYVGGQWVIEQFINESQLAQLQQNQLNAELNCIRLQDQIRDEIN